MDQEVFYFIMVKMKEKIKTLNKSKTLIRTHLNSINTLLINLEGKNIFEYPNTSGSLIVNVRKSLIDLEHQIKKLE